MKKIIFLALALAPALFANAQEKAVTNRYAMKLKSEADGSYSLINRGRYEAIVDLDKIPDLLVPYTYTRDKITSAAYRGCEVREFVYKTYPDYELTLAVDMAKSEVPAPFMVYIHGGGWARGNNGAARDLSQYLAMQDGVAGVRISYSLAGQPGVDVFVTVEDVRDAVKFIRENAEELNIDPARFGFYGGSAGAHLAAVAAMTIPGTKVMVGGAGIYDLGKAAITVRAKDPVRIAYFADRDMRKLKAVNPIELIPSKESVPAVLLLHGTGDITVECEQSREFARALKKKKAATVVLKLYENYDHGLTSMASDKKEETFFKTRDFIVANIF